MKKVLQAFLQESARSAMPWRPQQRLGVNLTALPLSPTEGFVLSRLDGTTEVSAVVQLTGLPREQVDEILSRLLELGALDAPSPAPESVPIEEDETERPLFRARFEQELRLLGVEQRAAMAQQCNEPDLSALCFDPAAQTILTLLRNPRFSLSHARLVARHHRDAQGIDGLCTHAAFAADDVVRRELLRNPQLQAGAVRRLWGSRRPLELYQWTASREVTEQTRRTLREILRSRFSTCSAEERVEVIIKTEGRALAGLAGIPIDSKTTSLLCARTYTSALLVQNIARWGSAPPMLLAHLSRQALVQRQPPLKKMVSSHPNFPRH